MSPSFIVLFVSITLTVCLSEMEPFSDDNNAEKPPNEVESLRKIVGALSRQVMLQQMFVEERIRSDGDSGVKQVRLGNEGTRNYFSDTHGNSRRLLSIHEHANNIRTVGLGEFIAVLNGVEFRTRHNDY